MKPLLTLILFAALSVGCGDKKDSGKTDPPPEPPAQTEEPEGPIDAGLQIATPADFEADVQAEITTDNLEEELSEIEQELGE